MIHSSEVNIEVEIDQFLVELNSEYATAGQLAPERIREFHDLFRVRADKLGHRVIDGLEAAGLSVLIRRSGRILVDQTIANGTYFSNNFWTCFSSLYLSSWSKESVQAWCERHEIEEIPQLNCIWSLATKIEEIQAIYDRDCLGQFRLDGSVTPSVSEEIILLEFLRDGRDLLERLVAAVQVALKNNFPFDGKDVQKLALYREARSALWPVVAETSVWFRSHGHVPNGVSVIFAGLL